MTNLDLSKVEFSKRDKFFKIKIPKKLSVELAYEIGFHIGDGHLTMIKRDDNGSNLFHIVFSGNWKEEKDFYYEVISPLIFRLYNKMPHIRQDHKNSIRLYFNSKAVAMFKYKVLSLPKGKKINVVRIPKKIMESSLRIRKSCLEGIVDSDFCLHFRDSKYPILSASFPIECSKLIDDIRKLFLNVNINPSICIENRKDDRYKPIKYYKTYRIDVSGKNNIERYVNIIGFKNPVHITKYLLWKRTGFCKPYTTLENRMKLLASMAQFGRASAW